MKKWLFLFILFISPPNIDAAIFPIVVPVSGVFDPSLSMSNLPFEGQITLHNKKSADLDLVIGDSTGKGLSQRFSFNGLTNFASDSSLDFALMYGSSITPNGNYSGVLIDLDAIDLYDPEPYKLVDLRLTVYDQGENFSGHWEWDNGRNFTAIATPEPSTYILSVVGYLFLLFFKRWR